MKPHTPAFARSASAPQSGDAQEGLTARQYYAAHAPETIPDWFACRCAGRPEEPHPPVRIRQQFLTWKANPTTNLSAQFPGDSERQQLATQFQQQYQDWQNAADTFDESTKEQRYFAWRWYYADQMCAQEAK